MDKISCLSCNMIYHWKDIGIKFCLCSFCGNIYCFDIECVYKTKIVSDGRNIFKIICNICLEKGICEKEK